MWGGRGACACGGGGGWWWGWGGGGGILGEVKARPKDIISFSLDYISKSKVQTSNPSSSPISLDTPARPADFGDLWCHPKGCGKNKLLCRRQSKRRERPQMQVAGFRD